MKGKHRSALLAALLSCSLSFTSSVMPLLAQDDIPAVHANERDETVLYATDYGADPTGIKDSTQAVIDVLQAAKEAKEAGAKKVRVEFEKGEYHIWKDKCEVRLAHTSNTSSTEGYGNKSIGILIEEQEDLTIEGNGALFMMHGNIMALAVIRSKNITLQNFSWDFAVPTTSELTVLATGEINGKPYTDFYVPKCFPHEINGTSIRWTSEPSLYTGEPYWTETDAHYAWCLNGHDPQGEFTRRYDLNSNSLFNGVESISHVEGSNDTILRFVYSSSRPSMQKPGMTLELNANGRRETTGALIWESENVTARKIDVHYMHGFGWLLQMSKDIYFYECTMMPREDSGHLTAGFADGIHASGAAGEVVIEGCRFSSLHDDPINIHGTFTRVETLHTDKHTLTLKNIHTQQGGYQQYFVGDKVQFFTRDTLESSDGETEYTVAEVVSNPGDDGNDLKTMVIRFEEELPDFLSDTVSNEPKYVAENITYTPSVTIRNNTFRDLAARAILCTTRKPIVIEDNLFYDVTMASIYISNDSNLWYESGPVRDVTIRNNEFYVIDTGEGTHHPVINFDPITKGGGLPDASNPIHKNVLIEKNTFHMDSDTAIKASSVENLTIKDNTILRMHPDLQLSFTEDNLELAQGAGQSLHVNAAGSKRENSYENLYTFFSCKDVTIENNTYDDGQKLYAVPSGMANDGITIKNDAVTIAANTGQPASSPVGAIRYASSDPVVVSVDANGNVQAKAAGSAQIYAWTEWNGSLIEADPLTITVSAVEKTAAPVIKTADNTVLNAERPTLQVEAEGENISWSVLDLRTGQPARTASISESGLFAWSGNGLYKIQAENGGGSDAIVVIGDLGKNTGLSKNISILNRQDDAMTLSDTEVSLELLRGDLYTSNNSAKNVVEIELPNNLQGKDFKTAVHVSGMPARESSQWDTASFLVMDDPDNYISSGRKSHYDGIACVREVNASGQEYGDSSTDNAKTSGWLGFTKTGSTVSIDFKADGDAAWSKIRDLDGSFLQNPKLGFAVWATNERNKTSVFSNLKIGEAGLSYDELLETESVLLVNAPNSAPTPVSASFGQDSAVQGESVQVTASFNDADDDAIADCVYRWLFTDENGSLSETFSRSDSCLCEKAGSLQALVYPVDESGMAGSPAITGKLTIEKGQAAGALYSVKANGEEVFNTSGKQTSASLTLPHAIDQLQLELRSDDSEITINGQAAENVSILDLQEESTFEIQTASDSFTLHVVRAKSSAHSLASFAIPELEASFSEFGAEEPVLTSTSKTITLQAAAAAGNVAIYNKEKTPVLLADLAKETEIQTDLSAGINTFYLCSMAEDGISYSVQKVHVLYVPSADTSVELSVNEQLLEADGEGRYAFRLANGETAAALAVSSKEGQSVRVVCKDSLYEGSEVRIENLKPGANAVEIYVKAQDQIAETCYSLNLVVPDPADTVIRSIAVDDETLASPDFETMNLTTQNDHPVIRVQAQDPQAIITIADGVSSRSLTGACTFEASLYEGADTVTITVVSPDGKARRTQTLNFTKAAYLSDLAWESSSTVGYGSIQKDKASEGGTLRLTDESGAVISYAKGIGTHANSQISFSLPADTYTGLEGFVGVDYFKYNAQYANVTFAVLADGTEVFNSGVMYGNTPQKGFNISLEDVSTITLKATQSQNQNWDAHSDFCGLQLAMKLPAKPEESLHLDALKEAVSHVSGIDQTISDPALLSTWMDAIGKGCDFLTDHAGKTQAEADARTKAIADARAAIENLPKLKASLQDLLEQAEDLDLSGTPAALKEALETAKAQAQTVLENPVMIEADLNKAVHDLQNAMNQASQKLDYSLLNQALVKAESLKDSDFDARDWTAFEEAKAAGKALLHKAGSQTTIDEAAGNLAQAMLKLRKTVSEDALENF